MRSVHTSLRVFLVAAMLAITAACAPTSTHRGTGETLDDAGITARVKTALVAARGINANAINVNTYRGEVQLSGFVDNPESIERAVEIARAVPGVRGVTNSLAPAPMR